METKGIGPRRVLLCGLEPSIEQELKTALESDGVEVRACDDDRYPEPGSADYIFCSFSSHLSNLLRSLRGSAPVVVVSRTPEAHEWIDAMEAGASDYCAAPFERKQIRWILEANTPACAAAMA